MSGDRADRAADDVRESIGRLKSGTLRMFGDWFGKPYDNIHVVVGAVSSGEDLIVTFGDDEQLIVKAPQGWEFDEGTFRIDEARRVTWRWYYYGRPKIRSNLYSIAHWVTYDGKVLARADADWYTPAFSPSNELPAAELL